ncbi:hypothetical protein H0H93_002607 [Arthromyces matolae]|nr:hypothetical protein H0H93_002607 [Arthromyces matolae]
MDSSANQLGTPPTNLTDVPRPLQEAFSKEEIDYLKDWLEPFNKYCSHQLAKGSKGDWVLKNVYHGFIEKFKCARPGGPNLETLKKKMKKWFTNHGGRGQNDHVRTTTSAASKPRALTAIDLFAKEEKEAIRDKANEDRKTAGSGTKQNLAYHSEAKKVMWDALTDEKRADFEERAEALNEEYKLPPDPSLVFEYVSYLVKETLSLIVILRRQSSLVHTVTQSLQPLCGHGWKGHGEVILFVQGAYRDKNDIIKTFTNTVSSDHRLGSFSSDYEKYKEFRNTFKAFAENHLPVSKPIDESAQLRGPTKTFRISFGANGFPIMPRVDTEDEISLSTYRLLCKEYIESVWKYSNSVPTPWAALAFKDRSSTGLIPDDMIDTFETLDPSTMKLIEVVRLYECIYSGQEKGKLVIQFFSGNRTEDMDIDEIPDRVLTAEDRLPATAPKPLPMTDFSPHLSTATDFSPITSSSSPKDLSPPILIPSSTSPPPISVISLTSPKDAASPISIPNTLSVPKDVAPIIPIPDTSSAPKDTAPPSLSAPVDSPPPIAPPTISTTKNVIKIPGRIPKNPLPASKAINPPAKRGRKKKDDSSQTPQEVIEPRRAGRKRKAPQEITPLAPAAKKPYIPVGQRYATPDRV